MHLKAFSFAADLQAGEYVSTMLRWLSCKLEYCCGTAISGISETLVVDLVKEDEGV